MLLTGEEHTQKIPKGAEMLQIFLDIMYLIRGNPASPESSYDVFPTEGGEEHTEPETTFPGGGNGGFSRVDPGWGGRLTKCN